MISGLKQVEALEEQMWSNFEPRLWVTLNYSENNLPRGVDRFEVHSKNISRFLNKCAKASKKHLSAIVAVENIDRLHAHLVIYSPSELSANLVGCWKFSAEGKSKAEDYQHQLKHINANYLLQKHHLDFITLNGKGKVRIYCPQTECGSRCLLVRLQD